MSLGSQAAAEVDLDVLMAIAVRARAGRGAAERLRSALLADLLSGTHQIPSSYDRFLDAA